ncbi:4-amino-4-deoxychorismate lyase [Leifsonia xyli subsp. cynodontis DSM 46306]|uniref:Uncharacterized protein n=1 Tax=Leifsonia xyli subsp. cynodontis DSM 46306 TaxID=1389489 RepID=U3P6A9_LEIXC|nr:4-amino-4-deoxychorismate lyase [Leifsonia xyli subsp. cynodontis DSM 46306]
MLPAATLVILPSHLPVIAEVVAPSPEERAWVAAVLAAVGDGGDGLPSGEMAYTAMIGRARAVFWPPMTGHWHTARPVTGEDRRVTIVPPQSSWPAPGLWRSPARRSASLIAVRIAGL